VAIVITIASGLARRVRRQVIDLRAYIVPPVSGRAWARRRARAHLRPRGLVEADGRVVGYECG